MSDSSSTARSGSDEIIVMYRCRYCPDQEFTAAERDLHRQQHRKQPKVGRKREGSPGTIFLPVVDEDTGERVRRKAVTPKKKKPGPKSKTQVPKKPEKIRSKKRFDIHIESVSSDGG